jgi:hypothetical protein
MQTNRFLPGITLLFAVSALPLLAQNDVQVQKERQEQSRPQPEERVIYGEAATTSDSPQVFIHNRLIMTIRAGAAGLSPEERADAVRKRLGPIITRPDLTAEDITIRQEKKYQDAGIYVRDRLLITVDRNLARANSTTPRVLAEQWAENLREALPLVNISVRNKETAPQLVMKDQVIMSIPTGADGLTPQERADVIRLRLGPILAYNPRPEDVVVRQREPGQTAGIYVADRLLISVDRDLAKAHQSTPEQLATEWAKNLQSVLPRIDVAVKDRGAPKGSPDIK